MSKEVNKKTGEELQQFLAFRKGHIVCRRKKVKVHTSVPNGRKGNKNDGKGTL